MNLEMFKDNFIFGDMILIDFANYLNQFEKNDYMISGILDLKHDDSEIHETYCTGAYVRELAPLHRKIHNLSKSQSEDVGISFIFEFEALKKDGAPDCFLNEIEKINNMFYAHLPLSWMKQLIVVESRKPEIQEKVRNILIENISFIEIIELWLVKKREELYESRRTNPSESL